MQSHIINKYPPESCFSQAQKILDETVGNRGRVKDEELCFQSLYWIVICSIYYIFGPLILSEIEHPKISKLI